MKSEFPLLQDKKNRFLADQFFLAAWASAIRHDKTWIELAEQEARDAFKEKKKAEYENIVPATGKASKAEHYDSAVVWEFATWETMR